MTEKEIVEPQEQGIKIGWPLVIAVILAVICLLVWEDHLESQRQYKQVEQWQARVKVEYDSLYRPFFDDSIPIRQLDEDLIAGVYIEARRGEGPKEASPAFFVVRPIRVGQEFQVLLSIAGYTEYLGAEEYVSQYDISPSNIRHLSNNVGRGLSDRQIRNVIYDSVKGTVSDLPYDSYREPAEVSNLWDVYIISIDQSSELIDRLLHALLWADKVNEADLNVKDKEVFTSPSAPMLEGSLLPSMDIRVADVRLADFLEEPTVKKRTDWLVGRSAGFASLSRHFHDRLDVTYSDSADSSPQFQFSFLSKEEDYSSRVRLLPTNFSTLKANQGAESKPVRFHAGPDIVLDHIGIKKLLGKCWLSMAAAKRCQAELDKQLSEEKREVLVRQMEELEAERKRQRDKMEADRLLSFNNEPLLDDSRFVALDVEFVFPVPDGFVDLREVGAEVFEYVVGSYDDGFNRMIAAYIPLTHAEDISNGIADSLGQRQINVKVEKGPLKKITFAEFEISKKQLKEQLNSVDSSSLELEAVTDISGNQLSNAYGTDYKPDGSPVVYKPHAEGDRYISSSGRLSGKAWGKQHESSMTSSLVYFEGSMLLVTVIGPAEALQWTRDVSEKWVLTLLEKSVN
jgi:hypothetical protein